MGGWFLTEFFTELNEMSNILFQDLMDPNSLDFFGVHLGWLLAIAMSCLAVAFVLNFGEGMVSWLRDSVWPTQQIKKGLMIMAFAILGKTLAPLSTVNPNVANGYRSALGISYTEMVRPLNDDAVKQSIKAIQSVDLVAAWNASLKEMRANRRLFVIKEIAKTDPALAATLAERLTHAKETLGNHAEKGFFSRTWGRMKGLADLASTAASAFTNPSAWKDLGIIWLKQQIAPIVALVVDGVLYVSMMGVAFSLAKVFLIYILSLKLASLLACAVLPPIACLAYFSPLRGLAVRSIKNIMALMIMTSLMGTVLRTALSDANIESMVAMSMSNQLANVDRPLSDSDVLAMKLETSLEQIVGPDADPEDGTFWTGVEIEDLQNSVQAIFRVLFVLGLTGVMLGGLYDLISGAMSGSWDPWRATQGMDLS